MPAPTSPLTIENRTYATRHGAPIRLRGACRPLAAVTILLWPLAGTAADVPEPEFHFFDCRSQYAHERDTLDRTRDGLDTMLCEAHLWLDGLFGTTADIHAARRSHGMISTAVEHSEREGWDFSLRARVQVALPALKNRLSAFVGREPDDRFVSGSSDNLALREQFPEIADDDQWLAGLGYDLPGGYRWRSRFRVGARDVVDPEIFVRNRMVWNALFSPDYVLNLQALPFWTSEDKFGLTLSADFAVAIADRRLIRIDLRGTRSGVTDGAEWRGSLIWYRSLAPATGLALEQFFSGDSGNPEPLREFGTRVLLRVPLAQQRMYGLLALGPVWYQPGDASEPRGAFFISRITLQMPFGL